MSKSDRISITLKNNRDSIIQEPPKVILNEIYSYIPFPTGRAQFIILHNFERRVSQRVLARLPFKRMKSLEEKYKIIEKGKELYATSLYKYSGKKIIKFVSKIIYKYCIEENDVEAFYDDLYGLAKYHFNVVKCVIKHNNIPEELYNDWLIQCPELHVQKWCLNYFNPSAEGILNFLYINVYIYRNNIKSFKCVMTYADSEQEKSREKIIEMLIDMLKHGNDELANWLVDEYKITKEHLTDSEILKETVTVYDLNYFNFIFKKFDIEISDLGFNYITHIYEKVSYFKIFPELIKTLEDKFDLA